MRVAEQLGQSQVSAFGLMIRSDVRRVQVNRVRQGVRFRSHSRLIDRIPYVL